MVIQNKLYNSSYSVSTKGAEIRASWQMARALIRQCPGGFIDAFLYV